VKFASRILLVCLLAACLPHDAKSAPSGDPAPAPQQAKDRLAGETQSPAAGALPEDDSECVPFTRALEKVGEIACVTGKVIEVHTTRFGSTYVNFCRDSRDCSFSIVIFAGDVRRLRDVRVLQGREIRITGKVIQSGRRAEMRWQKPEQVMVAVDEDKAARKKK
jgi:hypothetical protein